MKINVDAMQTRAKQVCAVLNLLRFVSYEVVVLIFTEIIWKSEIIEDEI